MHMYTHSHTDIHKLVQLFAPLSLTTRDFSALSFFCLSVSTSTESLALVFRIHSHNGPYSPEGKMAAAYPPVV